jgi:hypothetical protein
MEILTSQSQLDRIFTNERAIQLSKNIQKSKLFCIMGSVIMYTGIVLISISSMTILGILMLCGGFFIARFGIIILVSNINRSIWWAFLAPFAIPIYYVLAKGLK